MLGFPFVSACATSKGVNGGGRRHDQERHIVTTHRSSRVKGGNSERSTQNSGRERVVLTRKYPNKTVTVKGKNTSNPSTYEGSLMQIMYIKEGEGLQIDRREF